MKKLILIISFLSLSLSSYAQTDPATSGVVDGAANVFIDGCWDCDFDNFRREVNYVNFMRQRQEADVFVLVTDQGVGSGGDKYTMYFEGQNAPYLGMKDTLTVITANDDTDRIISDKLLVIFKKGIMPYVLKSNIADKITFSYKAADNKEEDEKTQEEEIVDPWDSWVFSISARGNLNGESSYNSLNTSGRLSANRVTEENKISINANFSYRESNFSYVTQDIHGNDSTAVITSLTRSQHGSAKYVKSLTDHWSTGVRLNVYSNTYSNIDFSGSIRPGVEYDYFPYAESDRRSLTVIYEVGPLYNNYVDTTILDVEREFLWKHSLSVDLAQKQKWGSIYLGLSYDGYLHDLRLYNVSFNPYIDWNIAKGLTLGIGGFFSLVGDQIELPKTSIDVPDLILRNRIVATSFNYWGFVNIRYTFGSKYNNVVNPRYGGGGGRTFYF